MNLGLFILRVVVGALTGNSSYPWTTMLQVDAPPVYDR